MSREITTLEPLRHRTIEAEGLPIHVVEGGDPGAPPILFLHGWPENWTSFEDVMAPLSAEAHVVAMDLPGIGDSRVAAPSGDKRTLARIVRGVIDALGLTDVTLVGHDVGGMIVYAYLHARKGELAGAVILNTVIPGVDPWSEVLRNPHVWHFGFHAVPGLPETLVAGRERAYFDYFYDAIAAQPGAVSERARRRYVEAYARPEALKAGFDWYRALALDEEENLGAKGVAVETPVLYLRGEKESGDLETYVNGLRESGLRNVQGKLIPASGHFSPEEQPDELRALLRKFVTATVEEFRWSPARTPV